jgi:integrase
MLFAGLRVSEACNLLVKDVDTERVAVFVRQGKWSKDRWAPCDVHTISLAKCYAGLNGLDGEHRLVDSSTRTIQRQVEEIYRKAEITWGPTATLSGTPAQHGRSTKVFLSR